MLPVITTPAFSPALPEILLAAGAMILILIGAYRGERATPLINRAALLLLAIAFLAVIALPSGRLTTFQGAFVVDAFAKFMKVLTLLGSAAAIVLSTDYMRREGFERFEFAILILLCTVGMLML